jgi:hypothetical protein
MLYKFNESRRHKIPKARYLGNELAGIRCRAGTARMPHGVVHRGGHRRVACSGDRGGQPIYSAIAIETGLALRLVFHQPLRQIEDLLRSIAGVLSLNISIPDHTTLSRRGEGLAILPKRIDRAKPLNLLIDSTGLKIYGEGEWLDQKHGIRSRRRWRKLHLGMDAGTHESSRWS